VLDRISGNRTKALFEELPRFLAKGDLLVLNHTRVLPARVRTTLERTGRAIEVLFSHPVGDGGAAVAPFSTAEPGPGAWVAMLGPARRLRQHDRLLVTPPGRAGGARPRPVRDRALIVEGRDESGLWRVRPESDSIETIMEEWGEVPLPPYLRRETMPEDRVWYQTVFASSPGAVAAPTAGLHFTRELLARLEGRGVSAAQLTLHVGPGTFLPVRADAPGRHRVLPERYEIPPETVEAVLAARARRSRVVAIGTTTVRALESAARSVGRDANLTSGKGWTDLTILPGHRFLAVDALLTNFHLPRSSLLLLVAAFAGRERILAAYNEARESGFRFYSYGDAMLIL
jgi:S-adenosylmethionine:tRNA ribosyltransferase-isomerase